MRPVIAILALALALPGAASARNVLNPSNTLSAALTSGSFSRADPPTAGSLDPGHFLSGAIDVAGSVSGQVAMPTIRFPDVSGAGYTVTQITLTLTPSDAASGTLDPFTGAAALNLHFNGRVSYTACPTGGGDCYSPSTTDGDPDQCLIEPLDLALRGSYDEGTGIATLRDDAFAMAAGIGGCDPPSHPGLFNAAMKLPSGTGNNSVAVSLQLDPVIRRGVIAAVTATPNGPRNALIDATASQAPAGVRSYEFDADGDPAGAFEAMTGDSILGVGFPTPGPHVVRVRVTDVDGDSDIASTTVDVPAGQGPPTPGVRAATIVKLPAARRCRASRTMRLRVLPSADAKVAAVKWSVGKRSRTTRGAKLNSPIVIRRLPRGAYTLKVVVTLANGNKLTEHRRYRTCPRTT
jgi:hypothetical protein